ncbi:AB hydrolase-1 domain-containing protein [Burkholderia multivorans]
MPHLASHGSPATLVLPGSIRMRYARAGNGPAVLFVHGSLCDFRFWQPQLNGLAAHFDCIAPSLTHYWPGPHAPSLPAFGWRAHVDELGAFIQRLGVAPVHLVGHSRGGYVAFHVAAHFPALVRSLTLADPGGSLAGATPDGVPTPLEVKRLRSRAAALIADGQVDAGLELFVDSVSRPGTWKKSPHAFRLMAADNAHTLAMQLRDALPPYAEADAQHVRCPTLLIDGEKSPKAFHANVDALSRWMPNATRITIPGASHGMNLARPGAFNRHLEAFFQSA